MTGVCYNWAADGDGLRLFGTCNNIVSCLPLYNAKLRNIAETLRCALAVVVYEFEAEKPNTQELLFSLTACLHLIPSLDKESRNNE